MRTTKKGRSGEDEAPSGQECQWRNQHEQADGLTLHYVKSIVKPPVLRLSNHALDVLLLLNEALGDLPREYYSAQLVSITARVGDLVFEMYQLAEEIAALTEGRVAA